MLPRKPALYYAICEEIETAVTECRTLREKMILIHSSMKASGGADIVLDASDGIFCGRPSACRPIPGPM